MIKPVRALFVAGDAVTRYLRQEEVEQWIVNQAWEKVRYLLRRLPLESIPSAPDYFYVQGHAHWSQHQLEAAKNAFEKARLHYRLSHHDLARAALCCLEIADISHSRGDYLVAQHCIDEADALLAQATDQSAHISARLDLMRGVLAVDHGQPAAGMAHAQRAAAAFQQLGDIPTEFLAHIRIVDAARAIGDFREAASRVTLARLRYQTGAVPAIYYARILNAELHIAWYRGDLCIAREQGETLLRYAAEQELPHQQLYARLLLGNIERGLGDYVAAERWYRATEQRAEELAHTAFRSWLALHRAWLCLLRDERRQAQAQVDTLLGQSDVGQWVGSNVIHAMLSALAGDDAVAEQIFASSLHYYAERGEALVVCALRCHLAYLFLRSAREEQARHELGQALGWLAEHDADYFPHWWYPPWLAELCANALQHLPQFTPTVRRMCVRHLQGAAVAPLTAVAHKGSAQVQLRVRGVLDELQRSAYSELNFVKEPLIRDALIGLLAEGKLKGSGLARLFGFLTTAERTRQPNPTLVAVFGYYVHGAPIDEIMRRLHCGRQLVNYYINQTYSIFQITREEVRGNHARRARLRERASDEGFI